jgi:signal transduction histidine kinase
MATRIGRNAKLMRAAPSLPGARDWATASSGGIALRPFLAITCAFWCYAAISAVLYASSMDINISRHTGASPFAPWQPRVLQYALLLPLLLACYWWSLRIGWQPLWRRLPAQLGLAVGFALLARPALLVSIRLLGDVDTEDSDRWKPMADWLGREMLGWLATFSDFLLRYGFGLALVTGISAYQQFHVTELKAAAVGRQLSAARLAALRMQLSPHTLFNLLNTIRGQIAWDPPAAQTMVVQLADLLRRLLSAGEREFSPLGDEIHFARLYLELQRSRFADRLSLELPESDHLPEVWVPSLILQPLVENAVVHGLADHDGPVVVGIEVHLEDALLRLSVTNQTAGSVTNSGGVGLRNVRERLAVHFGADADLNAGTLPDGRWMATITLPSIHQMPAESAVAPAPQGAPSA